jgi:hypothetical protein
MNFLEKFNTDDVFFRGVIIGLLSKLNETITYNQVGSDGIAQIVYIPFFYSLAGDESFLQDFYLSYMDCNGNPAFAEGNYDVIPRGILEISSSRIDTSAATTKFVRGSYSKEIEKEMGSEMVTYSAYLNPIPISVTMSCKIKVDTTLDAFKVQQSTLEILYKRFVYYFYYKGVRVPVQVSLADTTGDKNPNNFSFGYGTQGMEEITIGFSMELETYLPQFDLTTERFRGNLMQGGIRLNVEIGNAPADNSTIIQGLGIYSTQKDVK